MKKTDRKTITEQKRSLKQFADTIVSFDYRNIALPNELYLHNLKLTNQALLKNNNIKNLILF